MKTILITGGTGFLGVNLARYLLKRHYNVILLDTEEGILGNLKRKVKFIKGSIKNKNLLLKAFKDVDYIVHAAAALPIIHDRKEIFDTNVLGTKNVLESALRSKIKKVVFISTTAVYGVPKKLPEQEDDEIAPIGHYGESKVEGEKLCMQYQNRGLNVNIIRPKTFLGPERLGVFTLWFEAIHNNKPVFILGDGNNLYQLLDVTDLSGAILNSLVIDSSGIVFNVGAEKFGTWKQDLGALIKHAKSDSKIIGFPVKPSQIILRILEVLNLSPIVEWHYKTLPVSSYVSLERAKKILKFSPKKSNKDILIESYDWYKNNRYKIIGQKGTTHRKIWDFKVIDLLTKF